MPESSAATASPPKRAYRYRIIESSGCLAEQAPVDSHVIDWQHMGQEYTWVRTLQPGDVTQEGLTVLRVTPEVGGRLHVRFEDDDTLWRMHGDSTVWIRRPV